MTTNELSEITEIDLAVRGLFNRIPAMNEAQLIDTAIYAETLGRQAFMIRGACVSHILGSRQARLPGGRGKRDWAKKGIRSQMDDLAMRTGVHRRTLEIDARIYTTFFVASGSPQRGGARAASLSRELYVIALAAPDPWAAIKKAVECSADHSYGRKEFRAHVRALRQACLAQPPIARPTDFVAVKVRLSPEVGYALSELETWTAGSTNQVIAEAIRRLHKSYQKQRSGTGHVRTNAIAVSGNTPSAQEQLLF